MKLLIVCVALLGLVSALSLQKTPLQPRFAEVRNHPESTQDYHRGEDAEEAAEHGFATTTARHIDKKYTPGAACSDFTDCDACGDARKAIEENHICTWVPYDIHDNVNKDKTGHGACIEDRAPKAEYGEKLYECEKTHSAEVVDDYDDEQDDNSELHINGDPHNVDIAVLTAAEPVYTTALEQGAGEGPDSEAAGDWLQAGMTRQEYEGHVDAAKLQAGDQSNAYTNDGYHEDNGIVRDKNGDGYVR